MCALNALNVIAVRAFSEKENIPESLSEGSVNRVFNFAVAEAGR
jgi:hypothetical protein